MPLRWCIIWVFSRNSFLPNGWKPLPGDRALWVHIARNDLFTPRTSHSFVFLQHQIQWRFRKKDIWDEAKNWERQNMCHRNTLDFNWRLHPTMAFVSNLDSPPLVRKYVRDTASPFVYVLSVTAFMLHLQNWVAVAETTYPANLEVFFIKKTVFLPLWAMLSH